MRFVAVHGGCHGAWCWDFVKPEMEKLGHELVAVELPGHGKRASEVATLEGYRNAVVDQLRAGDVLIGHSSGGPVATLAANERPDLVSHLCLLASILPVEGQPLPYETAAAQLGVGRSESTEQANPADEDATLDNSIRITDDGTAFYFDRESAIQAFYNDCPEELVDWAYPQLVPEPLEPFSIPISVPTFWESDLPRSYIMGLKDRSAHPALALSQANRLGVVPLEIDSDHSPFLNRPAELAELFVRATETKAYGPLIPTSAHG